MSEAITFEKSCGNVFKDLGLPNPELEQLRAELALEIWRIMKQRNLTQAKLADALGVNQADVSRLKNGEFSRFSIERLFRFLKALDRTIEIHIRCQDDPQHPRRIIAA